MCRKMQQNGYMTVEAALILPLIFMMYLFLIRSFFWMYDRSVLEQDLAAFALRCASAESEKLEAVWQQQINAWDQEGYLWMSLGEPTVRKQGWFLQVTGWGTSDELGEWQVRYDVLQLIPEDWLRIKRRGEKGEAEK